MIDKVLKEIIEDMEKQIAEQWKIINRLKGKFDYKEKQTEIKTIIRGIKPTPKYYKPEITYLSRFESDGTITYEEEICPASKIWES